MKTLKGILLFMLTIFGSVYAQDLYWHTQAGGTGDDVVRAVATDPQGYVYAAIDFEGTINVGANSFTSLGDRDIIVIKYTPSGVWNAVFHYGGTLENRVRDMEVDQNGNVYLIGEADNFDILTTVYPSNGGIDMFIMKLDNNLFLDTLIMAGSSDDDSGYEIELDSEGNIYFSGFFRGAGTFMGTAVGNEGNTDAVFGKINSDFSLAWIQHAGGSSYDAAFAIEVVNDTAIAVGGEFIGSFTLDGNVITSPIMGNDQTWIAKMDTAGNYQWHYIATDVGFNSAQDITSDEDGNIYIAGTIQAYNTTFGNNDATLVAMGSRDAYLLKLDPMGNYVWIRHARSNGWFGPEGMDYHDGNLYLTGYISDEAYTADTLLHYGSNDFVIVNVTSDGDIGWQLSAGGINADIGSAITVDDIGRIYIGLGIGTGFTAEGLGPLASAGGYDALVASMAPCNLPETLLNFIGGGDTICPGSSLLFEIVDADTNAVYTSYANYITPTDTQSWDGNSVVLEVGAQYFEDGQNTLGFKVFGEGCVDEQWVNAGFIVEKLYGPNVNFTLATDEGITTGINTSEDFYGLANSIWSVDNAPIMSISDTLEYNLSPGQHIICLEVENIYGCEADTCKSIDISTGINDVYKELLALKYLSGSQQLIWSNNLELDAIVVDYLGRRVASLENVTSIDFSSFQSQVYLYKLYKNNVEYATGKVYVE